MDLPPRKQPTKGQQSSRYKLLEWRWELFTWALGTSALITVFILLLWFKEKPVSAWRSNVQMTAIIAALAQTAQSALMVPVAACIGQLKWTWFRANPQRTIDLETYDMASRGPEGSLKLLFKLSRPRLVSLGALATILMLAFPTFIQQSLQTDMRRIMHNGTAAITRRAVSYTENPRLPSYLYKDQYFDKRLPWLTPLSFGGEVEQVAIDDHMKNAIKSSMIDEYRHLSNVTGSCPTGDCTWAKHSSLAICTSFEDVWDQIVIDPPNIRSNISTIEPYHFTLPEFGPSIISLQNKMMWPDFFIATLSYNDPYNRSTPRPTDGHLADLANIYLLYHDNCLEPETGDIPPALWNKKESWKAVKATMRLCIQSLESSFNLTMNTRVVNEYTDLSWYITDDSLDDRNTTTGCNVNSTAYGTSYFCWNQSEPCYEPYQVWNRCNFRAVTLPDSNDDLFYIRDSHLSGIGWQIAKKFNTSAGLQFEGGHPYYIYGDQTAAFVSETIGPEPEKCNKGPGLGIDAFKRRVNNVATGMTNAMRTANQSVEVYGTAWETVAFIRLQPAWLILPAFVYMAITLLLISIIVETNRTKVPVWKHTSLGLLRGLKGEEQGKSRRDAKQDAQDSAMQLTETSGVWNLDPVYCDGTDITRERKPFLRWLN